MTFAIKKISDHGPSNPIVARTTVQVQEIVQFFDLHKSRKDRVFDIYLSCIQPRLLDCLEVANSVRDRVETIKGQISRNEISVQSGGRVVEVPQVARLLGQAENYLYNAKSALRDVALLFEPLFDEKFTHSRYNEIRAWSEKKFGSDTPLTKFIATNEKWIKGVVDMRNAVEHPNGQHGPLHVLNFELLGEDPSKGRSFQEPVWFLKGEQPASISRDMNTILHNLLGFAEEILVVAYIQLYPQAIIQFAEIPEADRDTQCPVRLRAILDRSKMKP